MKRFMIILIMALFVVGVSTSMVMADISTTDTTSEAIGIGSVIFPNPLPESTVNNKGTGYRGLPMQGEYHYPGIVPYMGPTTPSQRFRSVESMLVYADKFSVGTMQKALGLEVSEDPAVRDKLIKVYVVKKPVPNAALCGFVGHVATGKEGSLDVMFQVALAAHRLGANAIHITAQGVERIFKSSGGGIGFAITSSSLTANEDGGTARGGGTGYAWGSSKKVDDPWINAIAILVPGK